MAWPRSIAGLVKEARRSDTEGLLKEACEGLLNLLTDGAEEMGLTRMPMSARQLH